MTSTFKKSYEKALTHLMIARGGVAYGEEKAKEQGYSHASDLQTFGPYTLFSGGYYHGDIEADPYATQALCLRLLDGAVPLYDDCGPSFFGQESRFNGTFTDTQLEIRYAVFPIFLSDAPKDPIILVASVDHDYQTNSFARMIQELISSEPDNLQSAIDQMVTRLEYKSREKDSQSLWEMRVGYPKLF